jgi:hypothetical protein
MAGVTIRSAGRLALGVIVIALAPAAAHADLRVAFGNDSFSDLDPPQDDLGFTNDVTIAFWRSRGPYRIGGMLLDRWITEVGPGRTPGRRRWDQVDLFATVERPWGRYVVTSARLGPTFGGNYGGRAMQDGWHRLTGTSITLDEGLADLYDGDNTVGVVAGGRLRATVGDVVRPYGVVDGQVALGSAGLTSLELVVGSELIGHIRCVELGAHVEAGVDRFHTRDEQLTIPGGYDTGNWEPVWRVGVHVGWGRIRLAYEYRANEGGSGEPIGVVTVGVAQAQP